MSEFGDDTVTHDEYVAPKLNYSVEWDRMFEFEDFDESMLIPFMCRLSCAKQNVDSMQLANEYFFTIPKQVLRHFIVLHKDHQYKFMKSLKKEKKDDKFDFLIEAVCTYYGWSRREYELHKDFLNLMDEELHQELHRLYGFEKKECKLLGINTEKMKVKFEKISKVKGWF